jgi:hypothetical protein
MGLTKEAEVEARMDGGVEGMARETEDAVEK